VQRVDPDGTVTVVGGVFPGPEPHRPNDLCFGPDGTPDGFCFDADGNLYVCASFGNAVYVYSPAGELVHTLETGPGTQPTNCCLGDGVLYVTYALTGQLAAFDLGVKAAPVYTGSVAASGS
jgi:gluconolactonase